MEVRQTTERAILNWQSFNIGSAARVDFLQPGTRSAALNRVLSADPSGIYGTLTANGRVFLVNPSGIIFGKGSGVNVGSLVASTMAISDEDFNAGNYRFQRNGSTASILNQGTIQAAEGGLVALLGTDLQNDGVIEARLGSVILATGEAATLTLGSDNLYSVAVDPATVATLIDNKGIIQTDGGSVLMKASVAGDLVSSTINTSGVVRASTLAERNGAIVLDGATLIQSGTLTAGRSVTLDATGALIDTGTISAGDGTNGGTISANLKNLIAAGSWNASGTETGGTITLNATGSIEQVHASSFTADGGRSGGSITLNAGESLYLSGAFSASSATGQGGNISVTAPSVTVAGAQLHADGGTGGGRIRIGGGWQGNDSEILNATTTVVTHPSLISASATESGNGGSVVVWSESSTAMAGHIASDGGREAGQGGQIEVSSHDLLTWAGTISTAAPNGTAGSVLFDPKNITIDASGTAAPFTVIPLTYANAAAGDQHGSNDFAELSSGNILVASPDDNRVATSAGAVRLYKPDGTLLSTLSGTTTNDRIGGVDSMGQPSIFKVGNGNAAVCSPGWSTAKGAVTWINGTTGLSGEVYSSNSLVGSQDYDRVGLDTRLTVLTDGNYVVASPFMHIGLISNVGAVTWVNGSNGYISGTSSAGGTPSAVNSLVGQALNDNIGYSGVTALPNGRYVVKTPSWNNGGVSDVGAATWCNGKPGSIGVVSTSNSLYGTTTNDNVGYSVTVLTNGNYVVASPYWGAAGGYDGKGAVTLVDGSNGHIAVTGNTYGAVSALNSLVGSAIGEQVGSGTGGSNGITALPSGNYLIISPRWNGVNQLGYGAVTWANGLTGIQGSITSVNSLVGSKTGDRVGYGGITVLTNGNYVVGSPNWNLNASSLSELTF